MNKYQFNIPLWDNYYKRLLKRLPKTSAIYLEVAQIWEHHIKTMQVANLNHDIAESAFEYAKEMEASALAYRRHLEIFSLN